MSTRAVIKFAEWTLSEETAEGVTRGIFLMECLTCGAVSERVDSESAPVEMWALHHTGRNLAHRQFKLYTEWFLRVDPAPGNPLRQLEKTDDPTGRGS
jgi:hypothetical protein